MQLGLSVDEQPLSSSRRAVYANYIRRGGSPWILSSRPYPHPNVLRPLHSWTSPTSDVNTVRRSLPGPFQFQRKPPIPPSLQSTSTFTLAGRIVLRAGERCQNGVPGGNMTILARTHPGISIPTPSHVGFVLINSPPGCHTLSIPSSTPSNQFLALALHSRH